MLITPKTWYATFKVNPNKILHVGAHLAEEAPHYTSVRWGSLGICWIEAQPDLVQELNRILSPDQNRVFEAAVWGESGVKKEFNRMTNSQSSSLLELGMHASFYPSIQLETKVRVNTRRIDSLFDAEERFDFVNLDIQGAELEALIGMGNLLDSVNWVYSEVNWSELYKGCALIEEIDQFLMNKGFVRAATYREPFVGWGDALYMRTELYEQLSKKKILRWRIKSTASKEWHRARFLLASVWRFKK
jgi:FkbM family methyltransferase